MIVWFSKHQRGRFDAYKDDDEDWDWLKKKGEGDVEIG